MDSLTILFSTFILVFVGELGDKTQIAAGTGALANNTRMRVIFFSSVLALTAVASLTVFAASLVPATYVPWVKKIGGILLFIYGAYLFYDAHVDEDTNEELVDKNIWKLFWSHFSVVFIAEMGDKTQFATLAAAIENQSDLFLVFTGSTLALVSVTGITVWGVAKIPDYWMKSVQKTGAVLMMLYGVYMFF